MSDSLAEFEIDEILKNNRLSTALEPFAKAGALVPENKLNEATGRWSLPDDTPIITIGNAPGPSVTITYRHLREAAKAMEGQ